MRGLGAPELGVGAAEGLGDGAEPGSEPTVGSPFCPPFAPLNCVRFGMPPTVSLGLAMGELVPFCPLPNRDARLKRDCASNRDCGLARLRNPNPPMPGLTIVVPG